MRGHAGVTSVPPAQVYIEYWPAVSQDEELENGLLQYLSKADARRVQDSVTLSDSGYVHALP